MNYIHGSDIVEKWQKMSLSEQMGNIGSEVSRCQKWQNRDQKIFMNAFWRALELLDLTISDKRWLNGIKEITRVKELLCDIVFGKNQYRTTLADLDRYFTQYALATRK
ncbi:MAG: hypothetical protein A3H72_01465 [Candidatus Doudnabacteria bacterium RIFCSPLOWO2_02_FULL_48_8]|uniref:Uncharacterized protein n=1 Tax=Candidatus Doudnabacteria bacterium RIFCSPHIGHO2_01_FULL_46_24 TaxID=1817825 RepID=A0A1F5NTY0_9BACT|nr:MAG: hypothetical protein A2720_00985 [Candidatus Doudnabacteria bacterium RIFCSPHIGHO2_01_FULL_46_24]OGE95416.1 MAG: hypothetical protein A3H72_01465 [Candidatus Doudnabacteria bacterium RIFCSPLOWO2_02_FULL_48_8]OGE95467.1 MAG: hypothetical protein A3E98_01070 [Candidatus Doudnabacteria bacterium RIFCSPHIGHO2_12_FULL_48_11]